MRKGLLDFLPGRQAGSQAREYLLYAIGEIALVVIGILIALQINNWNEWRKDRVVENEMLNELKINIELNMELISFNHNFNERGSKSFKVLMDVMHKNKPWSDSLAIHIDNAFITRPPTLSFSAYESLENKGFEIIVSNELKQGIVDLYERYYNNMLTAMTRIINIELKPTIAPFTMQYFLRTNDSAGRPQMIPNNPHIIFENPQFTNILNNIEYYRLNVFTLVEDRSLNESKRILELIKNELGE